MASKLRNIEVEGYRISVITIGTEDYISLTDMVRAQANSNALIGNWLRSKNTIQYLGLWEEMHNPSFNLMAFDEFRIQAGERTFSLSPKQWIEATSAIGIYSKSGRYGGTYAQKDIAFKFATWLSPAFELYIIKDYQKLKSWESSEAKAEWDVRRMFAKINYRLQTDAIEKYLLPNSKLRPEKFKYQYASEADMLNFILFGTTAQEWKDANPDRAAEGMNMRDDASIIQLTVLANMESYNSQMIKEKKSRDERVGALFEFVRNQLEALLKDARLQDLNAQERLKLHGMVNPRPRQLQGHRDE